MKINFLTLAFSLCLAFYAFGQSVDTLPSIALPDVTISENRIALPFAETSRNITVINTTQIAGSPVNSVAELLQYASSVDVRQRGVHGIQADVSIRGGTFDQTLVLLNGVPLTDPQTGHHALNLPIDLENVKRIEVLKGPGARVFGQNAFAGAINIITKTPKSPFFKMEGQLGDYGLGGLQISTTLGSDKSRHYFSFSKRFSKGYRHNTDYDISNLFYQNQSQLGGGELEFLAGHTHREFGANGFYASPNFTEQYEEVQTSLASISWRKRAENWSFQPRFSWRRNQDEYLFVRDNPALYRNLHISNTLNLEFHANNTNFLGISGLGVDLRAIGLRSNNLGNHERKVASAFAEHRFLLFNDRLDITPGILLNYFDDFGPYLFPGVDVGYRFHNGFKLFGNIGNTYRVPTYTDLYYQDAANVGNPDLDPEAALSYELGAKGSLPLLEYQLSYFNRNSEDLIDWTKENENDPWQPFNFGRVQMQGIDADVMLNWGKLFNWKGLRPLRIGYTFIDAEKLSTEQLFSRYALENLNQQLTVFAEYRIGNRIYHSLGLRYSDRENLEDYSVLDSRLRWVGEHLEVYIEASNITDTQYMETNLVPMPGRWIRGGASYTFYRNKK